MEEDLETPTCSWEKVSKLDQRSSIVLLGRSLKNPAGRLRSWVAVGVDQQHRTTEVAAPIACDEPSGSPQHHQTAGGEEKP